MNGSDLFDALRQKFVANSDSDLVSQLGLATASNYRGQKISEKKVAGIVFKAQQAAIQDFAKHCIKPIVEFHPIFASLSQSGRKWEPFDKKITQYTKGLYDELCIAQGVYIFYDSCGKAVYVGKTKDQKLWDEMKNAFNRERGKSQFIRIVGHPRRNQAYKTQEEQPRQIATKGVFLHDIAAYFSAYSIAEGLIGTVEALLMRAFANDVLNTKMEKFPRTK